MVTDSRIFFFFFQAEDGIRDSSVTGVQTCALPIYLVGEELHEQQRAAGEQQGRMLQHMQPARQRHPARSEEHTSELQSHLNIVCRLLLEKKKNNKTNTQKVHTPRATCS